MTDAGDRTIITGASGWIGRVATDVVLPLGPTDGAHLVLAARMGRTLDDRAGRRPVVPVESLRALAPGIPTVMIHAGFPTQDQVEAMGADAYRETTTALRSVILEVIQHLAPLDLVYLSSGAASSVARGVRVPPRTQAYGEAKLADEAVFTDSIAATGGRLCIVRAFALSGPYMTKPRTYALGNMILQALDSGSISVHATHPVRRSYMAIDDMLRVALHAVGEIGPGEAVTFETAGEVVEVGDLASRVLSVLGSDPAAVSRPPRDPGAPADDYLGDPRGVGALAARAGVTPATLDAQIAATAQWLREQAGS